MIENFFVFSSTYIGYICLILAFIFLCLGLIRFKNRPKRKLYLRGFWICLLAGLLMIIHPLILTFFRAYLVKL